MNKLLANAARDDAEIQALMNGVLGEASTVSRRQFLKLAGLAGSGLVLAFYFGDSQDAVAQTSTDFAPNGFVQVRASGDIIIFSKCPEIGQGIKTAFGLIIAEELDADWQRVQVKQAAVNPAVYGRQGAGGSTSIPSNWDQLRQAGAMARSMLVSAAALEWNIPEADCSTQNSKVLSKDGRSLGYDELATKAARLPVPDVNSLKLKARSDYQLLGKRYTGVDNHQIVTGQPLFGVDTQLPGMVYASYTKCPAFGGKVAKANLDAIKKLPGVIDAFVIEGTGLAIEVLSGVAIIASSTWAAFSAKKQLQIEWDETKASKDSSAEFIARAQALAEKTGSLTLRLTGDVDTALKNAAKQVSAFYAYPHAAHATLEPQNCTAWFHDGRMELWSPTQQADSSLALIAKVTGLPLDKITVHQTRVGGGFGRRLMNDYACEAAVIAREFAKRQNAPVKLTWTREDDLSHDFYRVAGFHSLTGGVDAEGKLSAWRDHFITFTADGEKPVSGGNIDLEEFPALLVSNFHLTQSLLNSATPAGPWRAPRSNSIAFAVQCFLHELSVAAKRDHKQFLLDLLGEPRWFMPGNIRSLNTERAAAVIKLATEKAGWGKKLKKGHGLGLAFHFSHAGHVAGVAEVSVDKNKKLNIIRVVMAADVGPIINLSGAETQVQGAVIDALSLMFAQQITLEKGRVQEVNFDQYPLLRMPHAPLVEAHFIESHYNPTGLGEPALPPLAPAIGSAIFAATGERVRTLPLTKSGFSLS